MLYIDFRPLWLSSDVGMPAGADQAAGESGRGGDSNRISYVEGATEVASTAWAR